MRVLNAGLVVVVVVVVGSGGGGCSDSMEWNHPAPKLG